MKDVDVAIIGGGIGGLAAALYLQQRGIDCRVYEALPAFSELGVGINLMSHAIRALDEIGVAAPLAEVACEPEWRCFYNRHGQLIYRDRTGRHAGFHWPHYSVHRGDLHAILLEAVQSRIGVHAVASGHKCVRIDQDDAGVTIHFQDPNGQPIGTQRASVAIGCDGVNSTVRRQFYPDEGRLAFGGINMWRGSTIYRPILDGKSVILAGSLDFGKLVIYPMRSHADGTQLINWNVEVRSQVAGPNAWNRNGRIEDFIWRFESSRLEWVDFVDLVRNANMVLEYPMVDRDPVDRWTFGRVTLAGDAAHPMYPRSGNGAAQAILDARTLAELLASQPGPDALAAYEKARLEPVNRIVLSGRSSPPDLIIETVERLTHGARFDRLEDVISTAELQAIIDRFHALTGGDLATVNRQSD